MDSARQGIVEREEMPGPELPPDHLDLLERLPAIVYIAEPGAAGRFRYVSPQIETILGYGAGEWCGDRHLWCARLHPDDRERVLAEELAHRACPERFGATEYRLLRRDGETVWVRDEARLLACPGGGALWHGVLSDISERKEFESELRRRADQQAAVASLGERALEGAGTSQLLDEAVAAAAHGLDVEAAGMLQLDASRQTFTLRAAYGGLAAHTGRAAVPATGTTLPAHTLRSGCPEFVEDWHSETRFRRTPALGELDVRSSLAVQIVGAHGAFGVLAVHSRRPQSFRSDDVDFLQSLANVLADALQRQATEHDIRQRSLHDPLTGLPNRVLLVDRIERAVARLRRRDSSAAVLFLDLDHFKVINDSLGHHVGDELLAAVAPRLQGAVRLSDTVARLGGDEFAVLLEDVSGEVEALAMGDRLLGLFSDPFVINDSEHHISASIGIALARGGELPMELIRDADAAMYRAKEGGRARCEVFDEEMRGRSLARLQAENDLRRAVERGELRLDYQPLVSLPGGRIVGVEALVRWHHPQRGLIPPTEFIPLAEQTGLVRPIGEWVLDLACRQAAHWNTLLESGDGLEMAVNLSPVQIASPGLVEAVSRALQSSGLPAAQLTLEITETATLRDSEAVAETLQRLGELGVRLVLDDFGTGYSSLSYLPRFPLDALKIDRSFIDGLGTEPYDTAITEAIIAMARALSLPVVAEGVETEAQARALAALGCQLAQGYLFSRPVSAAEITARIRAGEHAPRLAA